MLKIKMEVYDKDQPSYLLQVPDIVLERIFGFLSYDEIAQKRMVSHIFLQYIIMILFKYGIRAYTKFSNACNNWSLYFLIHRYAVRWMKLTRDSLIMDSEMLKDTMLLVWKRYLDVLIEILKLKIDQLFQSFYMRYHTLTNLFIIDILFLQV